MKRYVFFGAILVGLIASLWLLRLRERQASGLESSTQMPVGSHSATPQVPSNSLEKGALSQAEQKPLAAEGIDEKEKLRLAGPELARIHNETHNVPVAFYGKVVDQDGNPLSDASISIGVQVSSYAGTNYPFDYSRKRTPVQKVTGLDGRFEVAGMKGDAVLIEAIEKDGYEPELERYYGSYGPQSTSFENPAVLKVWSTNVHESLITGDKSFVIIPDGRHYAIDLINGTIAEGKAGDLVVWITRPPNAVRRDKFAWSCELAALDGGLLESEIQAMFTAPEAGYTNAFTYQQSAGASGWGDSTAEKRFYLKSRNGQMYGRMTIKLFSYYNAEKPGLVRLSYAVNPSGSRLLR